jgi:predicted transcriptional regulator of viral defense system
MSYNAAEMVTSSTYAKLAVIAAEQWSLITRRQTEVAGVSQATLTRLVGDQNVLERVAHGVYHLAGAPMPDHVDLRAAWLQLAPKVPAWERTPEQGVVSHRSAAAVYQLGHLPADNHDFTLPIRKQSRRPDVRLHQRSLDSTERSTISGLPVTLPSRIASDLLRDREDPAAVAQVVVEAIRDARDSPGAFADELGPQAAHFGLRRGDGLALLGWLLDLVADPHSERYMNEAQRHLAVAGGRHH